MKVLLDTHVLVWAFQGRLGEYSPRALAAIRAPDTETVVSAVTIWEMAIKRRLGKLDSPPDALARLESRGARLLPIAPRHADRVADLPDHHGDPFDRLLVVQAQIEGMALVTGDSRLAAYDVDIVW